MRVVWNYIRCIHRSRSAIWTQKMGVVTCLDKDEVACCDEYVVACLDEGVVECLDNNNKNYFDVDFLLSHPLEYILQGILSGKCTFHNGYMKIFVWYNTYVHLYHDHSYKTPRI